MIDTHCHFLPAIDDGPATLKEALDLARSAVRNGIKVSVLTPHIHVGRYRNNKESIEVAYLKFRQSVLEHGIDLQLAMAAEVRLGDEILTMVQQNRIPFLGVLDNYKIMLLEMPPNHIIPGSEKLVEWLMQRGIRPIIAHPERNKQIIKDPRRIKPFIDRGCLIQLTACSLVGRFGGKVQACAQYLMAQGIVTVLASDAHSIALRPPELEPGRKIAEKLLGESKSWDLVADNPMEIINTQLGLSDHATLSKKNGYIS